MSRVGAAMMIGRHVHGASGYAVQRWRSGSVPDIILRGAISAGSVTGIGPGTAWGQELAQYQAASAEFLDAVYQQTAFMRLPGLRAVPFDVPLIQTTRTSKAQWTGEGLVKAGSSMQFANPSTIRRGKKTVVFLVESLELLRNETPQAEKVLLSDMTNACGAAVDAAAFDSSPATVNRPAGLAYNAPTVAVAAGDLLTAIANAFAVFKGDPSRAVFVANAATAIGIGTLRASAGGAMLFPAAGLRGGNLLGVPLFVSAGVPVGTLLLVDPGSVLVASDPVAFDTSAQTSLQMNDAPDNPATGATVMVSLWQQNLRALKTELSIDWQCPVVGSTVVITGLAAVTSKASAK